MSASDALTLAAANSHWVIEVRMPMTDRETGEQRTAVVMFDKRRLWQTADGAVVHGVRVRWTNEQGERANVGSEAPTMPQQPCSQPRYVPNGAERQSEANVRTARPYRAEVRTNVKAEGTG
jgi:hypothetical protein